MKIIKKFWVQLVIILLVAGIVGWYSHSQKVASEASINSFDDCVAAGNPVMESYPEQCRTPGGKHFVNTIVEQGNVVVEGEIVCLPHKGDGPHTLECAFGIKDDNGNHYGLALNNPDAVFELMVGERMIVNGVLKLEPNSNYDIVGTITTEDFLAD